ncbi:MAG: CHRD domain-containing protein [Alphaproteobacteria bacterium]|nr:CHRD domain-containing protein [Alphaproteobacteria bacterium]
MSKRSPRPFLTLAACGGLLFTLACDAGAARGREEGAHDEGHAHGGAIAEPKAEIPPRLDYPLDPLAGAEIGLVYESWLSPQQEGDEESDVPDLAPDVFRSTKPSTEREQRPARGHGIVAFNREFSRAYVQLAVANVEPEEIVMAHLHCGKPGQLGPILVDFGRTGDISEYFADGLLSVEVTNRDLERVAEEGEGLVGAFTAGCPIVKAIPNDRVKTIGGMAVLAAEGELYFNVHTKAQTFYGDIRGRLLPATGPVAATAAEAGGASE